mmetsp:Transcript_91922/g.162213  ORF Transcript_91922/g.162213 Transcript_91922/m.162213 type:complete len:85 (-) Transcript_91922:20-274(-)
MFSSLISDLQLRVIKVTLNLKKVPEKGRCMQNPIFAPFVLHVSDSQSGSHEFLSKSEKLFAFMMQNMIQLVVRGRFRFRFGFSL